MGAPESGGYPFVLLSPMLCRMTETLLALMSLLGYAAWGAFALFSLWVARRIWLALKR